MNYAEFLASKTLADKPSGIEVAAGALNAALFDWQKLIVQWALRRGRAAIFADCGLGKTPMQLAWADKVQGRVLIITPLAVAQQTIREGRKFGIECAYARDESEANSKITVTNYEKLHKFDPSKYQGVVLDESSILKSYTSATRNAILSAFGSTPYRLACTATPAPNDYMELGNHAEFLGVMTRTEMLCTFFIHDGGETSKWRLKGHAETDFWRWMSTWACMVRKPSDLGFSDEGFKLPKLNIKVHELRSETWDKEHLFPMPAQTLLEQRRVKRSSVEDRVLAAAELVGDAKDKPWLIWCELNDEGDRLEQELKGAVQVAGKDSEEEKEERLLGFCEGRYPWLISKPTVAGFGLNMQHCADVVFVNLSHSYEQFYQAIRRCWRFGQKKPVNVHVFVMDTEAKILKNIRRKQAESDEMAVQMARVMGESGLGPAGQTKRDSVQYKPSVAIQIPDWMREESECKR